MKYNDFKRKIQKFPIFSTSQIPLLARNEQVLRNQFSRWQQQGLIIKLKKGLYVLNKDDRKINPSRSFIANQLYFPSYISCEYALGYYGLIPERVVDVTSVTTKKTMKFENKFGVFDYHHLKIDCFIGFCNLKDEANLTYYIAEPEKAIVDFFYFNLYVFKSEMENIFEDSFRFQNVSELNLKKIETFAKHFNNTKLSLVTDNFCKFVKDQ